MQHLIGQKFGGLKVIAEAGRTRWGNILWACRCDCGKEHITAGGNLSRGKTKTCGHCYSNSYRLSESGAYMIGTFPDGGEFFIDIEDLEKVKNHTWYRTKGYALTKMDGQSILLHRFLMNPPANVNIDHINAIRTDNRRSNLRYATIKQNNRNVGLQKNNTTGAKGVNYIKRLNKFRAEICVDGRNRYLGCYSTVLEASEAYDLAAIHHFGEFAWLNNLREKASELEAGAF